MRRSLSSAEVMVKLLAKDILKDILKEILKDILFDWLIINQSLFMSASVWKKDFVKGSAYTEHTMHHYPRQHYNQEYQPEAYSPGREEFFKQQPHRQC
jgi:hypothetical protein